MANIELDYSATPIFKNGQNSFRKYTYRDIGTSNILSYKGVNGEKRIYDANTSNYDNDAIKTALRNLFTFRPGEEILEPEFGNSIYMYLYEPASQFVADKITRTIKDMIYRWEPRIQIIDTPIELDPDDNSYYIQIKYYAPMLELQSSVTLAINTEGSVVR